MAWHLYLPVKYYDIQVYLLTPMDRATRNINHNALHAECNHQATRDGRY